MHELLEAQARELRRLQEHESDRALAITRSALKKVRGRLSENLGPWDRAAHTVVRRQLSQGVAQLTMDHVENLHEVLPQFGHLSWEDTGETLKRLDRRYLGSVRPLRFDALEWLESNTTQLSRVRLQEYRRSFARYGAGAVRAIEEEVARTVLVGEPWSAARDKVWDAVRDVVGNRQWMVDRILRTESSTFYNGTRLAALVEEDSPEDPMYKRLVATFDEVTGEDSKMLDGQIRPVREPFFDPFFGKSYMAPPNRPHDREIVVGWRSSWGDTYEGPDAVSSVNQARSGQARSGQGPVKYRRRTLRRQIRALDRQLKSLALMAASGGQDTQTQEPLLQQQRDDLVRELSTLDNEEQVIQDHSRVTPSHITMLQRVSLGGRIRPSPLLEDLEREGLIRRRRSRRGKLGYVLTAAGTIMLATREKSPESTTKGFTAL